MVERTLLDSLAAFSVNVNGLIVPGRSVEKVLARHAFNLFVSNDNDTYKVSLVGSATAVRFKNKFILLCTNHQLNGVDPQRVGMLKDDGSVLITSGGFRSYRENSETDAFDIAAFDFSEPVDALPDLKKCFFDLADLPPDTAKVKVMAMLLTGFPSVKQDYELEDKNHLGLAKLNIVCLPDGQPNDPALLRLRAETPLNISPDGMSGGSAFVIQLVAGQSRAYFAGIILRGGKEVFHILKSGFVVKFLESVFF